MKRTDVSPLKAQIQAFATQKELAGRLTKALPFRVSEQALSDYLNQKSPIPSDVELQIQKMIKEHSNE